MAAVKPSNSKSAKMMKPKTKGKNMPPWLAKKEEMPEEETKGKKPPTKKKKMPMKSVSKKRK